MDQPIDYTIKTVDPTELFTKTLGMYQGIEQNQQALEANKLNLEAARQKIEAEKAGQERLRQVGELVMKAASPDATIDDMRAVMMTAASPEQLKAYESKLSAMTTEQKKAEFTPALQVKYALNSGKPDIAKKILMDRATALENSGDTTNAQRTRALAETIDDDGGVTVSADIASKLAFDSEIGAPALKAMQEELLSKPKLQEAEGKAKSAGFQAIIDQVGAENAPAMAKLERQSKAVGIQLDQARITEINNGIKIANENLKMAKEAAKGLGVKLPVATQALVNKVSTDSVTNQQMGLNYIDFANRVANSNVRGGFFGNANKFLEGIGGNPDLIRVEATKLINSDAMTGLPAGAASDKDVAMVREGYPNNANAATLAQFFRGTAKVKLIQAQTQSNTAEWLTMNGTLGPARAPMTIGGRQVKAGETFTKFNGSAAGEIIKNVDRQVARSTPPPTEKPTFRQPATAGSKPGWGKASIVPGA